MLSTLYGGFSSKPSLGTPERSENDTPFKTNNPENHTLSGHTSPLSPYKGVHSPPGFLSRGLIARLKDR